MRAAARRPAARQIWLAWLCALVLLGAQGLGHWHRIAHGAKLGGASLLVQGKSAGAADGWGHQIGDADCHLFDQLSHDPGLSKGTAPACLAMVAVQADVRLPVGTAAAAHWKRGARGPPSFA